MVIIHYLYQIIKIQSFRPNYFISRATIAKKSNKRNI